MQENTYKTFPYRWAVLFSLVPIIISSEIFWLTFAPIASFAESYYKVSSLSISLFSMSYMMMYILFTFPASWVIDKYGFKPSVTIGAIITAVFGLTRFLFAGNFTIMLISQFLLAAGQPFLVNISTKVPANWFGVKERSTASGILLMAQYIGFIVPMIVSPILVKQYDMKTMLGIYAVIAIISAIIALTFAKERPLVAPGPEAPKESMSLAGIKKLLSNKNFLWVLIISFISMGLFNTLMTMIEKILQPRGFTSEQAGIVGAVFVVTGIIGAVVVPMISDKLCKRIPVFIIGIMAIGPLCAGIAFLTSLPLILVCAATLGFLIMGMAPILFQHGAEVAYPVQEGVSFGFIMLVGQISGVAFVYLFDVILGSIGSIIGPMVFLIVFAILQIPIATLMKESNQFKSNVLNKDA